MKFKVDEIASYMGSSSLGVIIKIELLSNMNTEEKVWVTPLCGTIKWMNSTQGVWFIETKNMYKVPLSEQELCKLLYLPVKPNNVFR